MKLIRFCFPHKTASMFAHKILKTMSEAHGLAYFSANNTPPNHQQLITHLQGRSDDIVLAGPARSYVVNDNVLAAMSAGDQILDVCQIRNPLDIIVSQYFSHGWIHPDRQWSPETKNIRTEIQAGRVSVNDYALLELKGEAQFGGLSIVEKMEALNDKPDVTTRLIVTYEQFYDDYDAWVRRIVGFLPDSTVSEDLLLKERTDYTKAVVFTQDVFFENPLEYVEKFNIVRGKHIRSAAPGDHLHFLTKDQISDLKSALREACPILETYYR